MRKTSQQFFLDAPNAIPTMEQVLTLPWHGYYKVASEDGITFYVRGWLHKSYARFYYQCPCCVKSTRKSGLPRANTRHAIHCFNVQHRVLTSPVRRANVLNEEHQWIVDGIVVSVHGTLVLAKEREQEDNIPRLTVCAWVTYEPNMA